MVTAEEECPVFLGQAKRLHWGLPDPASASGTAEHRLDAFRNTRYAWRRQIAVFFQEELMGNKA